MWPRMSLASLMLSSAAVLGVSLLISTGGEAKVVIDHDLDVTTSQTLADDIFEVHGNVTVRSGATLTLSNCVLAIVGTGNGTRILNVTEGGTLVADSSAITGGADSIGVHIWGGCILRDTRVSNIETANASRGLWFHGGNPSLTDVKVSDCPNNTAVLVEGNLTARGCTFTDLGTTAVRVGVTPWPLVIELSECTFDGGSRPMPGATGLHIDWNASAAQWARVKVEGCNFTGLSVGLLAQPNSTEGELDLAGLKFSDCQEGLIVSGNRARVKVHDCEVEGQSIDIGIGLFVPYSAYDPMVLNASNLTVTGCERGVYVRGPSVGFSPRLWRIYIYECTYGLAVQGCTVEVDNSSIYWCDFCFEVEQRGHIDVRATNHEHMSAWIASGEEGAIVVYELVDVISCRWKNAGPISSGTLYLYGEDALELERLDLAALRPVEVVAWAKSRWNLIGRRYVIPTYFVDDVRFEAANFSIYDGWQQRVEILDNRTPELRDVRLNAHMDSTPDKYINTSTIRVYGHLVEEGTGFDRLEASLEGVVDKVVYVAPDGNWSESFGPLLDGMYNITFTVRDLAGNIGLVRLSRIVVDTVLPDITLGPSWHRLWNTSFVIAEGWTNEHAVVRFGTQQLGVSLMGGNEAVLFRLGDVFTDGEHAEALTVEDLAGNTNSIMLYFTVDTVPPSVAITSPAGGSWSSSGTVTIVGIAEEDTSLWVQGEAVTRRLGEQAFSRTVQLGEGDVTVVARVMDAAGNQAEASVLVRVDTTPPSLTIVEPVGGRVVTVEDTVTLKAEVSDAHLASVQLDGLEVPVLDGYLARTLQIVDGRNEFHVVAVDLAGNLVERAIIVLRDITPPTTQFGVECVGGRLVQSGEVTLATAPALNITVTPSEWVRAALRGGLGMAEGDGPLVFALALEEGPNEFLVLVEDEAGNKGASIVVRVTLDTTAPAIHVVEPSNGTRVEGTTVRVLGSVEPGSVLEVMGRTVIVAGDGSFNVQVPLAKGVNDILVRVVDRVGLESSLNLTLTRVEAEGDSPGPGAVAAALSFAAAATALAIARGGRRSH